MRVGDSRSNLMLLSSTLASLLVGLDWKRVMNFFVHGEMWPKTPTNQGGSFRGEIDRFGDLGPTKGRKYLDIHSRPHGLSLFCTFILFFLSFIPIFLHQQDQPIVSVKQTQIPSFHRSYTHGWSKKQLQLLLLIGNIESNPGPSHYQSINGQTDLKIFQINSQGLCAESKKIELAKRIVDAGADIVFIQETNFKAEVHEFEIPGYASFRKDRPLDNSAVVGRRSGGGVVTMIRENAGVVVLTRLADLVFPSDSTSEILQLLLRWHGEEFTASNLYIPPSTCFPSDLPPFNPELVLNSIMSHDPFGHHLIVCDINAHHEMWDSHMSEDPRGVLVADWVLDNGITVVNDPVRHTRQGQQLSRIKSSPDIAMHSMGFVCRSWSSLPETNSDHLPISFLLSLVNPGTEERERTTIRKPLSTKLAKKIVAKSWKKFNVRFKDFYTAHELRPHAEKNNVALLSQRLSGAFAHAKKCLPQGCYRDGVPWWCAEIDEAIEDRDSLSDAAGNSAADHQAYHNARLKVSTVITRARKEWYEKYCEEHLDYSANAGKVVSTLRVMNREKRPSRIQALSTVDSSGNKVTTVSTDRAKATAYLNRYARVSNGGGRSSAFQSKISNLPATTVVTPYVKAQLRREVAAEALVIKKRIDAYTHRATSVLEDDYARDFSEVEFDASIRQCSIQSASGGDGIHNRMLINLNQSNKLHVLHLINASYKEGICPKEWKCGTIIPLPKPRKDPSLVTSARPVTLTCVIAKVAERCVGFRLRYFLESKGKLTAIQSAYRCGRSPQEPIVRLICDVFDGFQKNPGLKTTAALMDVEKAFETVDPSKLVIILDDMGVPPCIAKWLIAFLSDRRNRVLVGTSVSKYVRFATGLPQGTVLGPLLFCIYFHGLAVVLSRLSGEGLNQYGMADDWTIAASARTCEEADVIVQQGLFKAWKWMSAHNLRPSPESEVIRFSLDPDDKDRMHTPLRLGTHTLVPKDVVRLLGVVLDSKLTMIPQVKAVTAATTLRLSQLSKISHSDWGSGTRSLKGLFLSYIQSKMLYAAPAWFPHVSTDQLGKLSALQNTGLRAVAGLLSGSNPQATHLETGVLPLTVIVAMQSARFSEKLRRFPENDPARALVTQHLSHESAQGQPALRVKQKTLGFNLDSNRALRTANITPGREQRSGVVSPVHALIKRQQLQLYSPVPPQQCAGATNISFHSSLLSPCSKSDTNDRKKTLSLETLADLGARYNPSESSYESFDLECYSDGISDKTEDDKANSQPYAGLGAGIIWRRGTAPPIKKLSRVSGFFAGSYPSEGTGISLCLEHVLSMSLTDDLSDATVLLVTDSKSKVDALAQGPLAKHIDRQNADTWRVLLSLEKLVKKIVIQWIPSHCGIERNEAVDKYATSEFKRLKNQQHNGEISYASIKSVIAHRLKSHWLSEVQQQAKKVGTGLHHRAYAYKKPNTFTDLTVTSSLKRADASFIAQLRVGHCRSIGAFYHKLNPSPTDANITPAQQLKKNCRWCHQAQETVHHVFQLCKDVRIVSLRAELNLPKPFTKILGSDSPIGQLMGANFARKALLLLQGEEQAGDHSD